MAIRKLVFPPRILVVRLTRSTTAPPDPNSATFTKYRARGVPASTNSQRPTSIVRLSPTTIRFATSSTRRGEGNVFTKSAPVPIERRARRASGFHGRPVPSRNPFATSFSVPSPPTTTTVAVPAWLADLARSAAWPGRRVIRTSIRSPRMRRKTVSWPGHRLRVRPFAEAGFTMNTTSAAIEPPEVAVRGDPFPIGAHLAIHLRRIPADRARHPIRDAGGSRQALVGRLVEEAQPPHEHVVQGHRHLLPQGQLDVGPDVRGPLLDSLPRGR